MIDKLARLLARCKCGVYLNVNAHRDAYKTTAAQWLDSYNVCWIEPDVRARIIELSQVVELRFCPVAPTHSYTVVHHNLDAALDEALACLNLSEPK